MLYPMKTVPVRRLRQSWPEVEAALRREGELFITRDGVKVARLVRIEATTDRRETFSSKKHIAWLNSTFGPRRKSLVDASLDRERSDD